MKRVEHGECRFPWNDLDSQHTWHHECGLRRGHGGPHLCNYCDAEEEGLMGLDDSAGHRHNAAKLMDLVRTWGRQLGVDTTGTLADMGSGDYEHLLAVFVDWCEAQSLDVELLRPKEER